MTKRKQTDDIYRQSRELIWHKSVVNNNGKRFVLLPYYQLVKPWLNASGALHFSTERSRLIIENFRRGDRRHDSPPRIYKLLPSSIPKGGIQKVQRSLNGGI